MGNVQFNSGKVLFSGGSVAMDPDCCCDIPRGDQCTNCTSSPNTTPSYIVVRLAGFPSGYEQHNGDYEVLQVNPCLWYQATAGSACTGLILIRIELENDGDLDADIGWSANDHKHWIDNLGTPPIECDVDLMHVMSNVSASQTTVCCNWATVTCEIVAA